MFFNEYLFGQAIYAPAWQDHIADAYQNRMAIFAIRVFYVFWSSLGQTFFISLFSAEIRADLGLSHGAFGSYYALATTLSALTLFWLGKLADTISVPRLSVMTLAGYVWLPCIFLLSSR